MTDVADTRHLTPETNIICLSAQSLRQPAPLIKSTVFEEAYHLMLIHDDIYHWEGWGGKLRLASGSCRLRIFDLKKGRTGGIAHLRPIIVVASDIPESRMSVRSCTGHIASKVTQEFNIDSQRMLFIEYYPQTTYGEHNEHIIPEKYDAVEFVWHGKRAIEPKWRTLKPPMLDVIKELVEG